MEEANVFLLQVKPLEFKKFLRHCKKFFSVLLLTLLPVYTISSKLKFPLFLLVV
jgi:hypothetical protein